MCQVIGDFIQASIFETLLRTDSRICHKWFHLPFYPVFGNHFECGAKRKSAPREWV